jgi:predicted GH43/DUF377 family glycosyl hydrolase
MKILPSLMGVLNILGFVSTAYPATKVDCAGEVLRAVIAPEWEPGNKVRHAGKPPIALLHEMLPFLQDGKIERDSEYLFGPKSSAIGPRNTQFDAVFNPTAWVETSADGKEKIHLIVRGEFNQNDKDWKRMSWPYHAVADVGENGKLLNVKLSNKPMLELGGPDAEDELAGGMEDFKFSDLSLHPADYQGKKYQKFLTYTAYDGKTARLHGVLFNEASDFEKKRYVKLGRLFSDEDVLKNPSLPNSAWSKSALLLQYRDSKNALHQIAYWNEGNANHGGIWSAEMKNAAHWQYPVNKNIGHVMTTKAGTFTQELVEPAFATVQELSPELSKKTGEKLGIYVMIHGDAPGVGYQVGYRVFSLEHPSGPPLYESMGAFFKPETPVEINQGQVHGVVFMPAMVTTKAGTVHFFWGAGDFMVGHATAKLKNIIDKL